MAVDRQSVGVLAAIALAIVAVIIVGAGLVGVETRTELLETGPLPEPPRDGSAGVVVARRAEPYSLLGFQWGRKAQSITVQMVLLPECAPLLDGLTDVTDGSEGCLEILAVGAVAGEGRNSFGERLVAIRLDVSRDCFGAISLGDRFPHPSGMCPVPAPTATIDARQRETR